jgi:hypothetical protein
MTRRIRWRKRKRMSEAARDFDRIIDSPSPTLTKWCKNVLCQNFLDFDAGVCRLCEKFTCVMESNDV